MYICNRCGEIVERLEIHQEMIDYYGSQPAYMEVEDSCCCGGEYVKAFECRECGDYFEREYLDEGICLECEKEQKKSQRHTGYLMRQVIVLA